MNLERDEDDEQRTERLPRAPAPGDSAAGADPATREHRVPGQPTDGAAPFGAAAAGEPPPAGRPDDAPAGDPAASGGDDDSAPPPDASAGSPETPADELASQEPATEALPEAPPAGDWTTDTTEIAAATSPRPAAAEQLPGADFAVVWRGYDVHAVDAYVAAAEAAIAGYEEQTLPTVAVQRALDRIGEQTASILREAEQAAEETTRASRAKADDRLQRAEREAAELVAEANARVARLDDDIERLWQERQRLIDATRELAARLTATADDAESRFPPAEGPTPPADAPPDAGDPPDPADPLD
jgi:hypothetical protein